MLMLARSESRSRLFFKAASAAFFVKQKKGKPCCCDKTVNVIQKVLVYRAGDAFFSGAGADPVWSEPESAPGPRTSGAGATQKSGGSATLFNSIMRSWSWWSQNYFLDLELEPIL